VIRGAWLSKAAPYCSDEEIITPDLVSALLLGSERRVYLGKLAGDGLQLVEVGATGAGPAMIVHRVPEGEGLFPPASSQSIRLRFLAMASSCCK
jgi:hypothetical protein